MRYDAKYRYYLIRRDSSGSIDLNAIPMYAGNDLDKARRNAEGAVNHDPHKYRNGLAILEMIEVVAPEFDVKIARYKPDPPPQDETPWNDEETFGED